MYAIYVLVGVLLYLKNKLRRERTDAHETKEFLAGLVFFPALAASSLIVISGWSFIKDSGSFGSFLSGVMADGMHIFMLLPIVILAFLIAAPAMMLITRE